MKKYFVGLCWNEDYKPYFHLKDYESGLYEFIYRDLTLYFNFLTS